MFTKVNKKYPLFKGFCSCAGITDDALKKEDIQNRRPGITCTLCGDCIGSCKFNSIEYRFFRIKPEMARSIYIVMVVVLHAVFMGVARI